MRTSKAADQIIKNNYALIHSLMTSKRKNLNTLSLILCEIHFSSPVKRFFEYLCWILLSLIESRKSDFISVGIAQIQIKHWKQYIKPKNFKMLNYFMLFINAKHNYDLADIIISKNDLTYFSNKKIIALYRGEARSYHLALFTSLKMKLRYLAHN